MDSVTYKTLPFWPGLILIGFFLGFWVMVFCWALIALIALMHVKQWPMLWAVPALLTVGFALMFVAMVGSTP